MCNDSRKIVKSPMRSLFLAQSDLCEILFCNDDKANQLQSIHFGLRLQLRRLEQYIYQLRHTPPKYLKTRIKFLLLIRHNAKLLPGHSQNNKIPYAITNLLHIIKMACHACLDIYSLANEPPSYMKPTKSSCRRIAP